MQVQENSDTKPSLHSLWQLHDLLLTKLICTENTLPTLRAMRTCFVSDTSGYVGFLSTLFSLSHLVTFIFTIIITKLTGLRPRLLETLMPEMPGYKISPPAICSVCTTQKRLKKWQHFQGMLLARAQSYRTGNKGGQAGFGEKPSKSTDQVYTIIP